MLASFLNDALLMEDHYDHRRRKAEQPTAEFAACNFHDDQSELIQSYSMSHEEIDKIFRKVRKTSDERHVLRYLNKVAEWSEKREDCYPVLHDAGIISVLLQVMQRYIYDVRIQERSLFCYYVFRDVYF